jgi:hypothetical protein
MKEEPMSNRDEPIFGEDRPPKAAAAGRQADTDPGLTTATLAGAKSAPEPRPAEERSFAGPAAAAGAAGEGAGAEPMTPLFAAGEAGDLRGRWDSIQAGFVDQPRAAVEQADSLVAAAMKRLAEMFADERAKLEGQWDRGDDVSTEDLRLALRRYRSFFSRLVSI